jgi:hypothetical protein
MAGIFIIGITFINCMCGKQKRIKKLTMNLLNVRSTNLFLIKQSKQHQHLELTQPMQEEDEVDIKDHDALKEESLEHLIALDPFLHTVRIIDNLNA